ncbi:MAG TPA: hypothetical protein VIC85_05105 [Ktedonobacterales bacterium]
MTDNLPMVSVMLAALLASMGVSVLACAVALTFFPWFRSGERKEGAPDQSTGGFRAVVRGGRGGRRSWVVRSSELPLLGGVAMLVAIAAACIGAGIFLNFSDSDWMVVGILLGAMGGFGLIGFVDDWHKVSKGHGISEIAKGGTVLVVATVAAVAMNRLLPSARFAYSPYSQIPGLGDLLRHTHYAWVFFFILIAILVTTTTSLAVDFTDGLDGLAGGTLLSAALSFAVIALSESTQLVWPTSLILLTMVGALIGYLPFNWPSSWKGRAQGQGKRRARLIMGDTGSLALGGLLALAALYMRLESLLLFVGGVFVLEGVSAVISARILVKFFRRYLALPRFAAEKTFPHTEFPVPFLGTPMHHHYDLLDFDRKRLVYAAWTLGAGLGLLGIASTISPFTWERYLARLVALAVILIVWQTGPWTRGFFIGPVRRVGEAATMPPRLGLFYGFPYRLFGRPLHSCRDVVDVSDEVLASPAERLGLWQRMSVFDARATLGYYCYRAGNFRDARRIWERIPSGNLQVRPDIKAMLDELVARAHLDAEVTGEPRSGGRDEDPDSGFGAGAWGAPPGVANRQSPRSWPTDASDDGSDDAIAGASVDARDWRKSPGWPDSATAYSAPGEQPAPSTTPPAFHGMSGVGVQDVPPRYGELPAGYGEAPRMGALVEDPPPAPAPTTRPASPAAHGGFGAPWPADTHLRPTRLYPVNPDDISASDSAPPPLWSVAGWAAASAGEHPPRPDSEPGGTGADDPTEPPFAGSPPPAGR